MDADDGVCQACRFYESHADEYSTAYGVCRRYAPRPMLRPHHADPMPPSPDLVLWPHVRGDLDWCGEWRDR